MANQRQAGRRGGGREARSEERREAILQSALAVIAERGYRGASLSAVAERVGLTQQGLLHYFPTKEALLVAVLEARDEWDTGGAAKPGGDAWRLDLYASLVEYNAMRPGIVQTFSALLGESVTGDHPAQEFFRRRYAAVRESAAATLRAEFGERLTAPAVGANGNSGGDRSRGDHSGEGRSGEGRSGEDVADEGGPGEDGTGEGLTPEQVAPLLIAVMDGLQFQWLLDPDAVDMPAAFRTLMALLRHGR